MKNLFLLLFFVPGLFLPNTNYILVKPIPQNDSTLVRLKNKKAATDQYITKHGKTLIALVKVPGKRNLVTVKGDQWPDQIEYTFNILKNSSGKIIFIAQLFDSESGDWSITYKNYFDEQGDIYAFSKAEHFVDDDIKGGSAKQTVMKYYDTGFNIIAEKSQITDEYDKVLKEGRSLSNQFHNKYNVYKNLADYISTYHIQLPN